MDPNSLILFALPVLLLVFMFTSQRKRQRAFADLQASLQPGQDILTTSGLYARVVEISDTVAVLEIAPGQRVRWDRRAIASVVTTADATGVPDVIATDTSAALRPVDPTTDEK